jgi:hypothetical protein
MASTYQNLSDLYFTHRGTVRQLTQKVFGEQLDAKELARLSEEAPELGRFAELLRHYLPERADERLEATKAIVAKAVGYGEQPGRYAIVWPDGEMRGPAYVQKPAAVKKWEQGSRHYDGLRLWDNRAGKFILGA